MLPAAVFHGVFVVSLPCALQLYSTIIQHPAGEAMRDTIYFISAVNYFYMVSMNAANILLSCGISWHHLVNYFRAVKYFGLVVQWIV
jgi:hypothetical protein